MSQPPTFISSRKVLSPSDLNCVAEATTYQTEMRRLLQRTQQDLAEASETARREGFANGYAEGVRSALADLTESVEAVRLALGAAENDLTGIVMSAIERMLGEMDSGEIARRAVTRALRDAADAVWVSIHASPEDHPALTSHMADIMASTRGTTIRAIESDPLLKPGEIMIETPKGRVHVGLRQQLARLQVGLGRMSA